TGMEMYTEYLSPAFESMTFSQATELCFLKLKLLLIAIETSSQKEDNTSNIVINPKSTCRIHGKTQGFFMAQSADEVKRYLPHLDLLWEYLTAVSDHSSGHSGTAKSAIATSRMRS